MSQTTTPIHLEGPEYQLFTVHKLLDELGITRTWPGLLGGPRAPMTVEDRVRELHLTLTKKEPDTDVILILGGYHHGLITRVPSDHHSIRLINIGHGPQAHGESIYRSLIHTAPKNEGYRIFTPTGTMPTLSF